METMDDVECDLPGMSERNAKCAKCQRFPDPVFRSRYNSHAHGLQYADATASSARRREALALARLVRIDTGFQQVGSPDSSTASASGTTSNSKSYRPARAGRGAHTA